jgi:serine protease Do
MDIWKAAALSGALLVAAGVGAAVAPVADAQSRNREPLVRAFQYASGDGRLGIEVRDADAKDTAGGVIVEDVQSDSPAEKAGIKRNDTIVQFDGERVRSVAQLQRLVRETPDGRTIQAAVVRNGQQVTLSVTPDRQRSGFFSDEGDWGGELPATPMPPIPPSAPAPPAPPARAFVLPRKNGFETFTLRSREGRLGIMTESLGDQLNDYFGVKNGVLVRSVADDSPASKAGVKAGDVIVAVNGHHVDEPNDISDELRRADNDDFTLDVVRDHKSQTLKGKLEPRDTRQRRRTEMS